VPKRRICAITGSRADYGLMRELLFRLSRESDFELSILATGNHADPRFGSTLREIEQDGLKVNEIVPLSPSVDSPDAILTAMGEALGKYPAALHRLKPDLCLLLGDRFEILAAAQAALLLDLPVAHLHGGETTVGVIDENIRHAITKLAHFHFTAAEPYRQRVLQMGENPEHVFCVGPYGLERLLTKPLKTRPELEAALGFPLAKKNFLVTYHAAGASSEKAARALLEAVEKFPGAQVIFTGSNADAGSSAVTKLFREYASANPARAKFVSSAGHENYLALLSHCDVVLGNSSSGIVEAPAVGTPTVNLGTRQAGRLRAASIIDCGETARAIGQALELALSPAFGEAMKHQQLPYRPGLSSEMTVEALRKLNFRSGLKKTFFDTTAARTGGTFVIAEAGVNHNGQMALAKDLILAAKQAGADAVKFQTFDPAAVATEVAPGATYQKASSQRKMLEKLALTNAQFTELKTFCDQTGIEFMSTPFDVPSVRFLDGLVKRFKIASGELTTLPLLAEIGRTGKPVILSTGMATLTEIEAALRTLRAAGAKEITLLHCTSSYPCPDDEANLAAIRELQATFAVPVGYSDHTMGCEAAITAVGLGATIVEKHFTLNTKLEGPDHRMSMSPADLGSLIQSVRRVEKMVGTGHKQPTPSEIEMKGFVRRSLVWAKDLPSGTVVTEACFTWKRPGTGLAPAEAEKLIGKCLTHAVQADTPVELADFAGPVRKAA